MACGPPIDVPFTVNWNSPQADRLVGWWPGFGTCGGVGTLIEKTGRATNGVFKGVGEPALAGRYMFGTTISFDGSNDYIEAANCQNFPQTRGSVSFWLYLLRAVDECFFSLNDGSADNRVLFYQVNVGNILYVYVSGTGGANNVWNLTSWSLPGSVWRHWVVTWDTVADDYHVYRDGVELTPTSTNVAGNPSGLDRITLGIVYDHSTYPFQGSLADIRVYDRILPAALVHQMALSHRWDLYKPLTGRTAGMATATDDVALGLVTTAPILQKMRLGR
jgi:hypothetical protein